MAEKKGYNRRDFLKIVGAGAGVAAVGCGHELPEKLLPYVVQPDDVVPGVAVWYSGSCNECSSGCGTLVRTREGRIVKVEGNPNHPVNRGGLCAQGQSTLQALYDPDRIREPLKREVGASFQVATWKENIDALAQAIADAQAANAEVVLVTRPTSGSEAALIAELSKKITVLRHVEYELLNSDALDLAAEQVFGPNVRTAFDFSKAAFVVSFGADFLETWQSPVEYALGWAEGRTPKTGEHEGAGKGKGGVSKFIHFEPRLSLTAGNADQWVMNNPGSESALMLALLKLVYDATGGKNLNGSARGQISSLVGTVDVVKTLEGTGVEPKVLKALATELAEAPTSLVVAGGAAASGAQAVPTAVLANLLNIALGNVGKSVTLLPAPRKARSSFAELNDMLNAVAEKKRKVAVLIVSDVNLAYILPQRTQLHKALSQIGVVAAASGHMDETTQLATLVLPLSHQLESWGDSEPVPGVFNLSQPAMAPLYKTQSLADTLISLSASSKLPNAKLEKIGSFYDYIREQWKARTGEADFEARWVDYVQKGGDWSKPKAPVTSWDVVPAGLNLKAFAPAPAPKSGDSFTVLAYPNVNSFDGRSANRTWMQELPNPMTSAVWGSWIEVNPQVAARLNAVNGDVLQVITDSGFIEAPIYINQYIHPQVIAVPIGQGHTAYGRYAVNVGTNVLSVLPATPPGGIQSFVTDATIRMSLTKDTLVLTRGSDYQYGRGIARTTTMEELEELAREKNGGHGEHAEAHEEGLALGPRPLPKQMYKQTLGPDLLYHWGMSIDLSRCTGCSACVVACTAENNVPTVGKTTCAENRDMFWIRIERYFDGPPQQPLVSFLPMLCQHCMNAPCEPVCPVYATYHTEEGINSMVYNRCVGTRYCMNNCSYKVRHFNWYKYNWPEPLNWQLNPDVTVREVGIMEKCSFCVQRIREAQGKAKDLGRMVLDGEIQPACGSSCPTKAIKFGNLNDKASLVSREHQDPRVYKVLDEQLNTQPSVAYLARVKNEALEA
ncbi:MAG: 4Fe-4S dicluster domain-containing protein [Bdellovibrionota bacterium]